jgi:hypothetical protein
MNYQTSQAIELLANALDDALGGETLRLLTGEWNDETDDIELTEYGHDIAAAIAVVRKALGGN